LNKSFGFRFSIGQKKVNDHGRRWIQVMGRAAKIRLEAREGE
jgi:hypothetical protein